MLGTSSGTPTKTRHVSGCAVSSESGKDWYLIDCGEGTQYQILKLPLSLLRIKAIFITHVHGDHCYGLPGLLNSMQLNGRKSSLSIYGPEGIKEFVEAAFKFTDSHISFEIQYQLIKTDESIYIDNRVEVRSCTLSHRVPSFAYCFIEQNIQPSLLTDKLEKDEITKGPVWGELKKGKNVVLEDGREIHAKNYLTAARRARAIVIAGDNDTPAKLSNLNLKIDVLVHEATFTEEILLKVGEQTQHSSAERISKYAEQVALKNLVLTHFSARYSEADTSKMSIDLIEAEAAAHYSGNLFLARDNDSYHLNSNYELKLVTNFSRGVLK